MEPLAEGTANVDRRVGIALMAHQRDLVVVVQVARVEDERRHDQQPDQRNAEAVSQQEQVAQDDHQHDEKKRKDRDDHPLRHAGRREREQGDAYGHHRGTGPRRLPADQPAARLVYFQLLPRVRKTVASSTMTTSPMQMRVAIHRRAGDTSISR